MKLLIGCAVVFGLSSCGDGSAPALVSEPTASTPEASLPEIFTTASGLECGQDLFEIGQYEPGFAEPASGFVAIQDAAADYWGNGDGTYRSDRGELIEVVDPPVVRYDNERGETQLILTFVEIGGRWLLELSEGCSYAPRSAIEGVPVPVGGTAQAVESAVVFVPDELSSYVSLHPELDQHRFAVIQPGEGGFDAVIVYRAGPKCGNLPDVLVDGDRTQLTVTIRTPVSGDCDAMEYDEAIGFDLATMFEDATITAE